MKLEIQKKSAFDEIKKFSPINQSQINKIEDFVLLLLQENHNFNLVGKSTLPDLWQRHILDSAQILRYIDDTNKKIADIGSGAGFPGMVISLLGCKEVHLVEKSFRKCEFLRKAKLLSPNRVFVHQAKLEELAGQKFDIITSRALASLDKLLDYCQIFLKEDGYGLFLKGKNLEAELAEAKKLFDFSYELFPSLTSLESNIIKVYNLKAKKQSS